MLLGVVASIQCFIQLKVGLQMNGKWKNHEGRWKENKGNMKRQWRENERHMKGDEGKTKGRLNEDERQMKGKWREYAPLPQEHNLEHRTSNKIWGLWLHFSWRRTLKWGKWSENYRKMNGIWKDTQGQREKNGTHAGEKHEVNMKGKWKGAWMKNEGNMKRNW